MAFRALLFSKSPETNAAMTTACQNTGIRAEVCSDIFSAIEKGKKQAYSCVIADWADQPEASFLLKRARESVANRGTVAIAIVDHDPSQAELRDNRLDFLIYRPISAEEADAVLAKACEQMQPASLEDAAEATREDRHAHSAPASSVPYRPEQVQPVSYPEENAAEDDDGNANYKEEPRHGIHAIGFRGACAAVLVLAAAFSLWRSHEILEYLTWTPEGGFHVLRESVAALFHTNQTIALPAGSPGSDTQPDAYFSRDPGSSNAPAPALRVVAGESTLAETRIPLRKAPDFPLPVPMLERRDVAPIRKERAAIPESMKNSAPIAPPVVVTVSPAQMMPVSAPQSQPAVQEFSEPVAVSEEAERALLVHTVNPVYPAEALAQKLHGPVVLQARVGRDGSVEDLKIVRGYFILGRAAIAAVKQWRFQPYSINGHAAATQTVITINFSYPPG
jgi:periplasmic protein TonB